MKITREILDEFVNTKYDELLADIRRLLVFDEETARDLLNDVLCYTYGRVMGRKGLVVENGNLKGYIYNSAKMSLWSSSSPYSRKRDRHIRFISLDDVRAE